MASICSEFGVWNKFFQTSRGSSFPDYSQLFLPTFLNSPRSHLREYVTALRWSNAVKMQTGVKTEGLEKPRFAQRRADARSLRNWRHLRDSVIAVEPLISLDGVYCTGGWSQWSHIQGGLLMDLKGNFI